MKSYKSKINIDCTMFFKIKTDELKFNRPKASED